MANQVAAIESAIVNDAKAFAAFFEKAAASNPSVSSTAGEISTALKNAAALAEGGLAATVEALVNTLFDQYGLSAFTGAADDVINVVIPFLESKLTKNAPAPKA